MLKLLSKSKNVVVILFSVFVTNLVLANIDSEIFEEDVIELQDEYPESIILLSVTTASVSLSMETDFILSITS